MTLLLYKCVQHGSQFIFDPVKWPREQMDEDFYNLSKMFNAMRSVVRVPDQDPKYKIAVLASKQVHFVIIIIITTIILMSKFGPKGRGKVRFKLMTSAS